MSSEQKNESFAYTYSSQEQAEVRKIREKYVPREADKMEQLRQLDESATQKGTVASLVVGVLSTLLMGVGMCCCMVWELFVPGVAVGLAGILGIALAYPVYDRITKKERERIAPEILRLTDELLK